MSFRVLLRGKSVQDLSVNALRFYEFAAQKAKNIGI